MLAVILLLVVCFCAICAKVLLDARHATRDHAATMAASLVRTLETDIARTIESYDLSLHAVVDNLAYPEITKISPELRQLVLFDRSSTAKHLDAITLLDENGIVRLDSRTPFPKPLDRSNRSYFQFHKNAKETRLHISEPIIARDSGTPVVVISRRLSNPDGSFAGVVAGSIKLSYFEELFKRAAIDGKGNISLAGTDGVLMMRWPYRAEMLGRNIKEAELYRHLAAARSGQFETDAVTDGIHRLVVYSQVADLPLVIGVGQSTMSIYARWWQSSFTVGVILLMLCAISVALAIYLAVETKRRNDAEERLAVLATTDSLTGLSNRLYLSQAFEREWERAMRDQKPLALMMCDADSFKAYNDRYGHQTGDRLLQAIGTAMNENIRRPTDVAARYGGDEFSILLPGTSEEEAARVAEQIRSRLSTLCDELQIARSHLSMGVTSTIPGRGEDPSLLAAAADRALYRAKERGRNRVETEPMQNPRPVLVHDCAA